MNPPTMSIRRIRSSGPIGWSMLPRTAPALAQAAPKRVAATRNAAKGFTLGLTGWLGRGVKPLGFPGLPRGSVERSRPKGPTHPVLALQQQAPDGSRHVFAPKIAVRPFDGLGGHEQPRVHPLGEGQRVGELPSFPHVLEGLEVACSERFEEVLL